MEIWKDIKGYEGLYQVSNLGKVKSIEKDIIRVRNGKEIITHIPEKILLLVCVVRESIVVVKVLSGN